MAEVRGIVRAALLERRHFHVDPASMGHPKFVWMPIENITKNTDPWSEEKLMAVRKQVADTGTVKPIHLIRDEAGNIHVNDGIHRLNVAKELGHTHVPAIWDDYLELER